MKSKPEVKREVKRAIYGYCKKCLASIYNHDLICYECAEDDLGN